MKTPAPVNRSEAYRQPVAYVLSLLLVPLYVSLFPLYKYLSTRWPETVLAAVPVVITIALLSLLPLVFHYRRHFVYRARSKKFIWLGALLCIAALLLPDPQFPAKRIHVAEYLLLSLVVRYAMARRLGNRDLLIFSALFTLILGIHDELLQGLHPARTFGLRDIATNGIAGSGGALIWHGFGFFEKSSRPAATPPAILEFCYMGWLLLSVILFFGPLPYYRTLSIPLWPAIPLCSALVFFALYKTEMPACRRHGISAVSWASFSFIFYPFLANAVEIPFY